MDTIDPFNERARDVVEQSTGQRWLNNETDNENLDVLVHDTARARQLAEPDGEPMKVDEHNDNDMDNETLNS